jgi:hypothetical protein
MFQLHLDSKGSSPSTICHIQAQNHGRKLSQNVLCGLCCIWTAAIGDALASHASAKKSSYERKPPHW